LTIPLFAKTGGVGKKTGVFRFQKLPDSANYMGHLCIHHTIVVNTVRQSTIKLAFIPIISVTFPPEILRQHSGHRGEKQCSRHERNVACQIDWCAYIIQGVESVTCRVYLEHGLEV